MNTSTHDKLKAVKQSFRFRMNGVASQSMREKGVTYKINWGIPLPELKEMAAEYGQDYDLAIELWKEDIRECQIMATFIMPPERMSDDLVEVWMERVRTQEMAEILAFNLLRYLKEAWSYAFQWIAADNAMYQLCGYNLLSCLFAKGQTPDERQKQEFIDQARTALQDKDLSVKHAAYNAVIRFCSLGASYEKSAEKEFKDLNIL